MSGIANHIVATAEVQTVTVDATGGTFTVTWNGATTNALAFNVSAAGFTAEMDAIADGVGNVVVTGGPGSAGGGAPYTLTWAASRGNVPAPTTNAGSLTGGAGTAVVATSTAGVTALADPWLSVGAHAEPTHTTPDQGDWQWNMMEVAAWMADEAWSSEPACVSPVIAALCNAVNDTLPDSDRQDLKGWLRAAPDGVIDTVDAGKETTREWMVADWFVRTLLPMWMGYASDVDPNNDTSDVTDAAAAIAALPALAAGTFDETATLAALEAAGRAVWAWQATQELSAFEQSGGGSATWANSSLPVIYETLGGDYIDRGLGIRRGVGGRTRQGADDGLLAVQVAFSAADQAVWDLMRVIVPVELFTGRSGDYVVRRGGSYVPGSTFMLLRDVVWAITTRAAKTGAGSAAYLDPLTEFAGGYAAATAAATSLLTGLGFAADTIASIGDLLDDLCAA